ncbi:33596_t:CDS:2, partial [Gigaspora margarita]
MKRYSPYPWKLQSKWYYSSCPKRSPEAAKNQTHYNPEKNPAQNIALGLGLDLKPLQMLLNECNDIMQRWVLEKEKSPNIYPKFFEAKNIDDTDKSEIIGVEKDKEKDKLNKIKILAEPNYVRCGTRGQKEMEALTDKYKASTYCQKLVEVTEVNHVDGPIKPGRRYESSQKKETKENAPVESEEVVDGKLEPILGEKAFNCDCELKIKKLINLEKENKMEEKKVHHCNINFEKPLDDLDKALEIKPKDISVLEKEENK